MRQPTRQKVTLKNPTATPWKIKANISSNSRQSFFSGPEGIDVPANAQADYEITYSPQTMTSEHKGKEESHLGSVFFPLPDGQAIIYDLVGKSLPPTPVTLESKSLKAKVTGSYMISVTNWLRDNQRFDVALELDKPDATVFIRGANTIDLMGEATKEFKLSLSSLKASSNTLTVTFRNPVSQEYLLYKVPVSFEASDVLSTYELQSIVRESSSKLITVENPLDQQVVIKPEYFSTDNDNLSFNPTSFKIPP